MSTSPLSVDVFVTPIRPYAGGAPHGPGDEPTWAPMSSTLIAGENEAILVDALMTNDQADALAGWAQGFGKRITGVHRRAAPVRCRCRSRRRRADEVRSGLTRPLTASANGDVRPRVAAK